MIEWLIIIGLASFFLFTLFDILRAVNAWIVRVFVAPRRDAQESYEAFQAWQADQLDGTPYRANEDPTRPDDGDGLNPLVELWRRGRNT